MSPSFPFEELAEFEDNNPGMFAYCLKVLAKKAVEQGSCPQCDFCTTNTKEIMIHFTEAY